MFTLPIDMEFGWLAPLSIPSRCRVRIDHHPVVGLICLMSERHDNPGVSITNGIESLIESLIETFEGVLDWERVIWIEHYPEGLAGDEHFDRVYYEPGKPVRWEPMDYFLAVDLLSSSPCADDIFQTFLHRCNLERGKPRRLMGERVKRKLHHLVDGQLERLWRNNMQAFLPRHGWQQ